MPVVGLVKIQYFGPRWDSPYLDGIDNLVEQVPAPIGTPCLYCEETIQDGDRGLLQAVMRTAHRGSIEPVHAECHTRMALGSPAHWRHECFCQTGQPEPDYPGTLRQEAQELIGLVNEQRATVGVGPLW